MRPSSLESARAFLAARRIAVVGVSRDAKDFSRYVLRELAKRGHDVVPVNPALAEAEGRRCFARVQDVAPPADAALLMTAPAQTDRVLQDCVEAGIRRVWLHRGGGPGAATPAAIARCAAEGIELVQGLCPLMAVHDAGFPHRVHHAFRRILAR
jgi:predicted CoA-binding protein